MPKPWLRTLLWPTLALTLLTGCGGSDNDDQNNDPNDEITCTAPQVPNADGSACIIPESLVAVSDQQIAVYYHELTATNASDYADWRLHAWNGDNCPDGYSATMVDQSGAHFANWDDGIPASGYSDQYGLYWILDINPQSSCANFIIHDGDTKATGSADMAFSLADHHYGFTFHNISTIYYQPVLTPPVAIDGAAAHWLDNEHIVWDIDAAHVALLASADASITIDDQGQIAGNYQQYDLTASTLPAATATRFPHLADMADYTFSASLDTLRSLLKDQLVAVAYDQQQHLLQATQVQTAGVLDALYTAGDNDADEATLGPIINAQGSEFTLWAPTAQQVNLLAYDADKNLLAGYPQPLTEDPATGIWHLLTTLPVGTYYQYQLQVYHPNTGHLETLTTTDPYSLSLSTNSDYSQLVDLNAEALKPAGWDDVQVSHYAPADMVIYEAHVRDFSATDNSVPAADRGKYRAFTDRDSDGMRYLEKLRAAGLTHIHLLPVFDMASVNKDPAQRVSLDDSVSKFCGLAPQAALCEQSYASDASLRSVLEQCDPQTDCAASLMDQIRDVDDYNWGYDPYHFAVPEGSYATNAEGTPRITEFRDMVLNLHQMGFNVVMDVVYNHTHASGTAPTSVLDKIVPGYYQRLDTTTGQVLTSTCCSNTATEHRMMGKLMIDTLKIWVRQYQIDAFRFDLMGDQPLALMEEALQAVQAINPHVYFYGEGWDLGDNVADRFVPAQQAYLGGSGIGSYSDRLRDVVRGGSPFDSGDTLRETQGLANGLYVNPNELNSGTDSELTSLLHSKDIAREELAGNLKAYQLIDHNGETVRGDELDYNGQPAGYAESPIEIQSYVSKHDNQTLWDINQYKIPTGTSTQDRVRMQLLALSFPLFAQSIPFIHMGSELMRSKSMERDSYNSGDWFNAVHFDQTTNNWNVGLPREDNDGDNYPLIRNIIADPTTQLPATDISNGSDLFATYLHIRSDSPLLHLGNKDAILARVDFRNTGPQQQPGLIVMTIDDGQAISEDRDARYDGMLVAFNLSATTAQITLPSSGMQLHPMLQGQSNPLLTGMQVTGDELTLPGFSTAVVVMPQGNERGVGLPVTSKSAQPAAPYGQTPVYLRGSMNEWGTTTPLNYTQDGVYQVDVSLAAGDYTFKLADADWGTVNIGYSQITIGAGSLPVTNSDDDMAISITTAGTYRFTLDASDSSRPILVVSQANP